MSYSKDPLRAGLVCLIAGLVGCTDATAPVVPPAHRVATWLSSPDLPVVRAMLGDASDRLVRPIADETKRARLESDVRLLAQHLGAGDVDASEQTLALTRHELDGAAAAGMSEPDIATFVATLDGVQRLMSGTSTLTQTGNDND